MGRAHAILGQGPSFICADGANGSQSFDRFQAFSHAVLLGHAFSRFRQTNLLAQEQSSGDSHSLVAWQRASVAFMPLTAKLRHPVITNFQAIHRNTY